MTKRNVLWISIVLTMIGMICLTACSNDNESENQCVECPIDSVVPTVTFELTDNEKEIVSHGNDFAFNLFSEAQDPIKSQVLSPISIVYALGMLNNGATGETQAQINKVLGFEVGGAEEINTFCYKMLRMAPSLDSLTKVMISNTIYMNKDYVLKEEFLQKANDFYFAQPETRDFYDGHTLDVINQWASDHTEKMIEKVLDELTFKPWAISYLLNAIYFKGSWTSKFDKEETVEENFKHVGYTQEVTKCKMMHQRNMFDYTENDDYQVLRLPYGNKSFVMTILLPKTDSNAIPKVPSAKTWQLLNGCSSMCERSVDVKLPRFETNTDIIMNNIMSNLGMPDAFDSEKADFRNFCNVSTYIGLMKQVAKIRVDEEGTEAAAVTVTAFDSCLGAEPDCVNFHANHPFLYVISEKHTGAVFFIGQFTGY